MVKKTFIVLFAFTAFLLSSCSKKNIPSKSATVISSKENSETSANKSKPEVVVVNKPDTVAAAPAVPEKPTPKPEPKPDFPNVISVNDNAASKSVDGRLFYDVLGHRYWRNYKDGKYYLFDKSMYSNPDFKPQK